MSTDKKCNGDFHNCDLNCSKKVGVCTFEIRRLETAKLIRTGKYILSDGTVFTDGWDRTAEWAPGLAVRQKKRKAKSERKKCSVVSPVQETPITIDNFFVATYGLFTELEAIPEGFVHFFASKGSDYYGNADQTQVVRVSDHWGYNIRFCAWFLVGYGKINSWMWKKIHGKKKRIGIIKYSEFEVNNKFLPTALPKPKVRIRVTYSKPIQKTVSDTKEAIATPILPVVSESETVMSESEIDAAAKAYGVKTINGVKEWEQEQFGSKRQSFCDGIEYALKKIKNKTNE